MLRRFIIKKWHCFVVIDVCNVHPASLVKHDKPVSENDREGKKR